MKKYYQWIIIGFELVMIVSLLQGIRQARGTRSRVDQLANEKRELMEERAELLTRLEYVQSADYLDKVAREELNLAKPGETVVIVPEEKGASEPVSQSAGKNEELPNYLKWWKVLRGE